MVDPVPAALPAAICDTHVHVIGSQRAHPMLPDRHYTPPLATVDDLRAHLQRVGATRTVIVQPSVYGVDNRCVLDALAALQGQACGIAVLPQDVPMATLRALDRQGVRGIRLNLESVGQTNAALLKDQLQRWATPLAELGWHLQIYAPFEVLAACAEVLVALPVPTVMDHIALWSDASLTSPAAQQLLRAFDSGSLYVKLSGSYRVPLRDPDALHAVVTRLLHLRSDRLLWASDWPHTNRAPGVAPTEESPYRPISAASLVAERTRWLPSPWAQQVLVDNPARLYRFGAADRV